jgi:hypothetical protein
MAQLVAPHEHFACVTRCHPAAQRNTTQEYCSADLSRYREQRVGLRWRTQPEVITGKGQFVCGAKRCDVGDGLVSYEVNFAYEECGEQKNALVKLRVCPECGVKLNFKRDKELRRAERAVAKDEAREHKRRRAEAGAVHVRPRGKEDASAADAAAGEQQAATAGGDAAAGVRDAAAAAQLTEAEHWGAAVPVASEASREDEFDAYFKDMFA